MAYLHCHNPNCNWSQDDFWDEKGGEYEGYTPFRSDTVQWLKESLFEDRMYFDRSFFDEMGLDYEEDDEGCYMRGTDFVAFELERKARSIRNIKVRTNEEWKQVRESWVCPECGSDDWDID